MSGNAIRNFGLFNNNITDKILNLIITTSNISVLTQLKQKYSNAKQSDEIVKIIVDRKTHKFPITEYSKSRLNISSVKR